MLAALTDAVMDAGFEATDLAQLLETMGNVMVAASKAKKVRGAMQNFSAILQYFSDEEWTILFD